MESCKERIKCTLKQQNRCRIINKSNKTIHKPLFKTQNSSAFQELHFFYVLLSPYNDLRKCFSVRSLHVCWPTGLFPVRPIPFHPFPFRPNFSRFAHSFFALSSFALFPFRPISVLPFCHFAKFHFRPTFDYAFFPQGPFPFRPNAIFLISGPKTN